MDVDPCFNPTGAITTLNLKGSFDCLNGAHTGVGFEGAQFALTGLNQNSSP
jgi:hypothetical protein